MKITHRTSSRINFCYTSIRIANTFYSTNPCNFLLRLLYLFIFFNCITFTSYSQQGNNWYFGENAGLTFNTNPPSALLDGQLFTFEGCASISDNSGRLLFYTNGVTVWNKQHQVMPNGADLKGNLSATNSAIIIPKPGSDSIYYIFTAGAVETNNEGYFFSEVDISLQGGLGDVTAVKNIPLYSPSTEKLTAVRHSNGIDVWVITKALGNTEWKVYKVDCNGVNTTPVTSLAGHQPSAFFNNVNVGCIKSSPDGTKIAAVNTAEAYWELFQFNTSTGILSNGLLFPASPRPYGVEFSPDSKLAYIGQEWLPPNNVDGGVFQYNLATYDSAAIDASKMLIGNAIDWVGALQLGPDNKIYCGLQFQPFLAVINSPNLPGLACNFSGLQVETGGNLPRRGLPVFFPGLITNKNADFNYTINTDCSTVNFSATTTVTGNVTWQWDFGDGTTGTGQNISHTYAASGPTKDTVRLTVSSTGSCGTAIAVKEIILNPGVVTANFRFHKQCGNLTVSFLDSSTATGSPIQNWLWDFGDGNTSNQQYPLHVFATFGTYTVKLTVGTAGGCISSATIEKTVVVEAGPVADFINSKTCVNQLVSFTDNSTTTSGNITAWNWDFGDGTSSILQNPQKTYSVPGTYEVKLVVISSSGCFSDVIKRNITVAAAPIAGINVAGGCENKIVSLQDASVISSGTITRWYWSLGNGNTSVEQNPAIIYPAHGSYTIKHVVESNGGCISDTAITTISIESTPVAGITVTDGCEGQIVHFIDSSSIDFGAITNWNWDFGDGNTAVLQNPTHIYSTPGSYTVKLMVQSANGCMSDTVSKSIDIAAKPEVSFTNTEACIGQQIQFTNQTILASGTITGYSWDFGDGSTSAIENPVHTYNREGDFTATLTAFTGNGCTATSTKTFHIAPVRAFAGNDTTVVTGQPVPLHASGGKFYQWSPPDFLNKDNVFNPVAILDQDQHYRVQVTTEEGCTDYDDITIHVIKGTDIYVPNAFVPNGKNRIFRPILAGVQELYFFSVYNRWGKLVFTTREPGKGWDGTINGAEQQTGVFVWALRAKDYLGQVINKNGTVVLIR
ncbi:MAG: PKD domain-containing protein [Sphingobacteriales bacterium]